MNKKTLIVPMAGKSSRVFTSKPKWMLTHPKSKNFLGVEAVLGFRQSDFDKIVFVTLEKYQKDFSFLKGFNDCLKRNNLDKFSTVHLLKKSTKSQSETVYQTINDLNIKGTFVVKDADNYFKLKLTNEKNFIATEKLENLNRTNPSNKSYISVDVNDYVMNIIEKKVISNLFSVGAYGFEDAELFKSYFKKLNKSFSYTSKNELYLSYIIYNMLLDGVNFKSLKIQNYKDWGDQESWNQYKESYKTIFCDIDGTLIENSSENFPPYIGEGKPIIENIQKIADLKNSGCEIILTTSRDKKYKAKTKEELKKYNIPYDNLIMGLLHGKRVVINDYSNSNSFPTAESINIQRNSGKIQDFI